MVWMLTFLKFCRKVHALKRVILHGVLLSVECSVKEYLCEFFCYCDISDAYENARFLCEQYYATAPGCDIECHDCKLSLFCCTEYIQHRLRVHIS